MKRIILGATAFLLLSVQPIAADLVVKLEDPTHPGSGTNQLQENKANQQIGIFVSGSGDLTGMTFNLQIGDGGDVGSSSSRTGPIFQGAPVLTSPPYPMVDFVTGTIFQSNQQSPYGDVYEQLIALTQMTSSGTINVNSTTPKLLATVTIDTTGFFAKDVANPWKLTMADTLNGSSNFIASDSSGFGQFIDGTLTLVAVPEPGMFSLLAAFLAMLPMLTRYCRGCFCGNRSK